MAKQDIAKEHIVRKPVSKNNHLLGRRIKLKKKTRPAISFDYPNLTRIPSVSLLTR